MLEAELSSMSVLSDAELDLVSAGLGDVNVAIGIQIANQTNIAVFSRAIQGGSQGQGAIVNAGWLQRVNAARQFGG